MAVIIRNGLVTTLYWNWSVIILMRFSSLAASWKLSFWQLWLPPVMKISFVQESGIDMFLNTDVCFCRCIMHMFCTLLFSFVGLWSLEQKSFYYDEILQDNFKCSQWWKFHQNHDIFISMLLINFRHIIHVTSLPRGQSCNWTKANKLILNTMNWLERIDNFTTPKMCMEMLYIFSILPSSTVLQ